MHDTESPEPLAALEILEEMNADDEKDLVEQFCCTQPVEVNEGEGVDPEVEKVKGRREIVDRGSVVREFERERVSSVRETLERTESSEESEEESKVVPLIILTMLVLTIIFTIITMIILTIILIFMIMVIPAKIGISLRK